MSEQKIRRRFPWLKSALAVSLVFNLVALGLLGGIVTRTGPQGSILRAAISALPSEERRALRRETRAVWRDARAGNGAHAVSQQLIEALREDDFDAEAFSQALRHAQDRLLHISNEMHDRLVVQVAGMSAQQRAAYADALQERIRSRNRNRNTSE